MILDFTAEERAKLDLLAIGLFVDPSAAAHLAGDLPDLDDPLVDLGDLELEEGSHEERIGA